MVHTGILVIFCLPSNTLNADIYTNYNISTATTTDLASVLFLCKRKIPVVTAEIGCGPRNIYICIYYIYDDINNKQI